MAIRRRQTAKRGTKARRKRKPAHLLKGKMITVRIPSALLDDIDDEIEHIYRERHGERTTRAQAIRVLIRAGLEARRGRRGQE